jgi:hypothetical protein
VIEAHSCRHASKRTIESRTYNPKEGAVGKQQCETVSTRNESWTASEAERQVWEPTRHYGTTCKGNHRCNREAPLQQKEQQYTCRLLRMSSLEEEAM